MEWQTPKGWHFAYLQRHLVADFQSHPLPYLQASGMNATYRGRRVADPSNAQGASVILRIADVTWSNPQRIIFLKEKYEIKDVREPARLSEYRTERKLGEHGLVLRHDALPVIILVADLMRTLKVTKSRL